jgi:hypothetical protein
VVTRARLRLRRRGLRGAAVMALLCAASCQAFIDSAGHEEPKRKDGLRCEDGVQCLSGFCVDEVCCNSACDGICDACSAIKNVDGTDGECGRVEPWKAPNDGCEAPP